MGKTVREYLDTAKKKLKDMGKTVREYLNTAKKKLKDLWEWDGTGKIWSRNETSLLNNNTDNIQINEIINVQDYIEKVKKENPYRTPRYIIYNSIDGVKLYDGFPQGMTKYINELLVTADNSTTWKQTGIIKLYVEVKTENGNPFTEIPIIEEFIAALRTGNRELINSFDIVQEVFYGYIRSKQTNANYVFLNLLNGEKYSFDYLKFIFDFYKNNNVEYIVVYNTIFDVDKCRDKYKEIVKNNKSILDEVNCEIVKEIEMNITGNDTENGNEYKVYRYCMSLIKIN